MTSIGRAIVLALWLVLLALIVSGAVRRCHLLLEVRAKILACRRLDQWWDPAS